MREGMKKNEHNEKTIEWKIRVEKRFTLQVALGQIKTFFDL